MTCECKGHPTRCFNHPDDCGCTDLAAQLAKAKGLLRQTIAYPGTGMATPNPLHDWCKARDALLADQPSEVRHVCGMHGFWQEAYENGAVCPACQQQSKSAE